MAIKTEKIEIIGINVSDVDKAVALFREMFGIEFISTVLGPDDTPIVNVAPRTGEVFTDSQTAQARPTRIAIDTRGYFELMESHRDAAQDGMRNIHFKVDDIDAAIAEMQRLGVRLVGNVLVGTMREAIFDAGDLFGCRICLVQYPGPSLMEALTDKPAR
ncbi:VOC family protein [Microbacterium sp. BWT-B31]|uniref:VOC family protein n=1 Tax=Microbacterium sp. BWT-B31 TaxID=3232072 RepID=UPI003527AF68